MRENRRALDPWAIRTREAGEMLIDQGFTGVIVFHGDLGIIIGAGNCRTGPASAGQRPGRAAVRLIAPKSTLLENRPMQVSDRMLGVIAEEEGVVLKAYRCPAGVLTIGVGHTSRAGAPKVSPGMRITREEAFAILGQDLRRTFEPRVTKALPGAAQNVFDGAASFDFNTGRIHNPAWVAKFKAGEMASAEASFKSWNKGGGRVLKGLVRRRKREAGIIFRNDYGTTATGAGASRSRSDEEVLSYQTALAKLGFYKGALDGDRGPATASAVEVFQAKHGLTVDGIVGPATRSALTRALEARTANRTTATGGVAAAGTDAATDVNVTVGPGAPPDASAPADGTPVAPEGLLDAIGPLLTLVAAAALIWAAFWLWRNRGRAFAWLPEGVKDFIQDRTGIVVGRRVAA